MLSINLKGVPKHVTYLPAQEASAQEGARLPQENEDRQRPQGSRTPQSKGQSEAQLLIPAHEQVLIGNIFRGGAIRPLGVSAKSVKEHDP